MFDSFRSALGVFTVLPAPVMNLDRTVTPRIMRAFPRVGLFVGVLAGAGAFLTGWLSGHHVLAAVVGLCIIAAVTGAMHLDGLADTADGIGSRRPVEEALVIMRKSDIGPMGVAALVLVLLLQVASLVNLSFLQLAVALALGPMLGRVACACATGEWLPSARPSGFGALFTQITSRRQAWIMTIGYVLFSTVAGAVLGELESPASSRLAPWLASYTQHSAAMAFCAVFFLASAISLLTGRLLSRWLAKRLGGMTGDTFGAVIESSTSAFWFVLALFL